MTRLIFAGTPEFAATILADLLGAGYDVPLVLTQPDRPTGRGMRMRPSAVNRLASTRGLTVSQPASLRSDQAAQELHGIRADAMVVAAYGLILPLPVLRLFPCINVHASLLPRWRGAAPVQRAILAGDSKTGICIMQMAAGLDVGPIYLRAELLIDSRDTTSTLHDKLAELGAQTLIQSLPNILNGTCTAVPQATFGITYAEKVTKAEAALDWRQAAIFLERQVRAFYGFPVAHTTYQGDLLRVWRAEVEEGRQGRPGEVIEVDQRGVLVACGNGALRLLEVQRAGARRMTAVAFVRGTRLQPGEMFSSK